MKIFLLSNRQRLRGYRKMDKYFWFVFADGYQVCAKGFSATELYFEQMKHGKLISKREAY